MSSSRRAAIGQSSVPIMAGVIVAATLALNLPWLISRGFAPTKDALRATLPWWAFSRNQILDGRLPAWDPARLAGTPHMANIQAGFFYPLNWLLLPLPPDVAIGVSVLLHIALGGVLLAIFARSLGLRVLAATLAGLAYVTGAFVAARVLASHVQILQAMAWAPLLLLTARQLAIRASPRWAAGLALAICLSLLAGYPAVTIYTGLAAGIMFMGSLTQGRSPVRSLALAGMAGLVAVLVTAPAWWSQMQLTAQSTRSAGFPLDLAARGALRIRDLPMLVWPWFLGAVPLHNFTDGPRWMWWEAQSVGSLTLTLMAAVGVVRRRHDRAVQLLVLSALVSLVLALGTQTPVYTALIELLPPLRLFRIPARFLMIWAVVVPVLGAMGFQEVLDNRSIRLRWWLAFAVLLSGGILAFEAPRLIADGIYSSGVASGSRVVSIDAGRALNVTIGMLAALALLGLLTWRSRLPCRLFTVGSAVACLLELAILSIPAIYSSSESLVTVTQAIGARNLQILQRADTRVAMGVQFVPYSNLGDILGFQSATAYDPLLLGRTYDLLTSTQPPTLPTRMWGSAASEIWLPRDGGVAFDVLNVGHFLKGRQGQGRLLSRTTALPSLSVIEKGQIVAGAEASLAAVRRDGFDPHSQAVLESALPPLGDGMRTQGQNQVRILSKRPGYVQAQVTAPRGGYLVFSESYYPGWVAESAGKSVPMSPADHAIMATRIGPGTRVVTLRFTTPWLLPSLVLSGLGCLGLIALLMVPVRCPSPSPSNYSPVASAA